MIQSVIKWTTTITDFIEQFNIILDDEKKDENHSFINKSSDIFMNNA